MSSGVNWMILNVCCRAFHTFLWLVSKLVLTWEIGPLSNSVSFFFLQTYIFTQISYLTGSREHYRTNRKETPEFLRYCVIFLPTAILISFSLSLCTYMQMILCSIQHFSCFRCQNTVKSILLHCFLWGGVFCFLGFVFRLPYFLSSLIWVDLA